MTNRLPAGFRNWLLSIICCLALQPVFSQQADILLKGGHLVDPKTGTDADLDVAITGDKIVRIARDIPANSAKKVIDVKGLIMVPGLIDIHTHVFVGPEDGFANGFSSVSPDDFTFKAGITTVVDAGTSGPLNFHQFKQQTIDRSATRVLAFLNIFDSGFSSGNATSVDLGTMHPQQAADTAKKYAQYIVGMRIGHYSGKDWTPFDLAVKAASLSNTPLFVECHLPELSLEGQLQRMRSGDIITHAYEQVSERMPIVDSQGQVRPFVLAAQKRGILFDVGHGGAGFWYSQAIPALKQGLAPNSFGSDLHRFSMNSGMKSMLFTMSKYLAMGMPLNDVIRRGSWSAAQSIKRPDLGQLSEGGVADIAVLRVQQGDFGFVDAGANRLKGDRRLDAEMTVRAGKIVWDLNGRSAKEYAK